MLNQLNLMKQIGIVVMFVLFCGFSSGRLNRVIEEGNLIVKAFDNYQKDFGVYPNTLADIYPSYLKSVATLVDRDFPSPQHESIFRVKKYKFLVSIIPPSDEFRYGFQITLFSFPLFSKSRLIYNPSRCYADRRFETVEKVYRGWAVVKKYRQYGEENVVVVNDPERNVNIRESIHDPFQTDYYKTRLHSAKSNIRNSVAAAREAQLEKSQQQGE